MLRLPVACQACSAAYPLICCESDLRYQLINCMQAKLPEGSQTHFRSIVTDQFCRVLGSEGSIYAIGDAATIQQVRGT